MGLARGLEPGGRRGPQVLGGCAEAWPAAGSAPATARPQSRGSPPDHGAHPRLTGLITRNAAFVQGPATCRRRPHAHPRHRRRRHLVPGLSVLAQAALNRGHGVKVAAPAEEYSAPADSPSAGEEIDGRIALAPADPPPDARGRGVRGREGRPALIAFLTLLRGASAGAGHDPLTAWTLGANTGKATLHSAPWARCSTGASPRDPQDRGVHHLGARPGAGHCPAWSPRYALRSAGSSARSTVDPQTSTFRTCSRTSCAGSTRQARELRRGPGADRRDKHIAVTCSAGAGPETRRATTTSSPTAGPPPPCCAPPWTTRPGRPRRAAPGGMAGSTP
ncbi:hypothetical protein QJS66_13140 [Kocuria rhizophila]|nr:hypothetical protein QJS66_13140 [Kocuria rhizophila]